jgi:hypothetical protein
VGRRQVSGPTWLLSAVWLPDAAYRANTVPLCHRYPLRLMHVCSTAPLAPTPCACGQALQTPTTPAFACSHSVHLTAEDSVPRVAHHQLASGAPSRRVNPQRWHDGMMASSSLVSGPSRRHLHVGLLQSGPCSSAFMQSIPGACFLSAVL